jgi:hypothetical protein
METHDQHSNRLAVLGGVVLLAGALALMPACSPPGADAAPKDAAESATPAGVVPAVRKNLTEYFQTSSDAVRTALRLRLTWKQDT